VSKRCLNNCFTLVNSPPEFSIPDLDSEHWINRLLVARNGILVKCALNWFTFVGPFGRHAWTHHWPMLDSERILAFNGRTVVSWDVRRKCPVAFDTARPPSLTHSHGVFHYSGTRFTNF
jgi:hypothetical protein